MQQEELAADESVSQFANQYVYTELTFVFRAFKADLFEVGIRCHVKSAQFELGAETLDVQV